MSKKVTLVDSGQDFQEFICDDAGKIIKVLPDTENSVWLGSYLPANDIKLMQEGKYCAIRRSDSSSYGYLRHKIEKIEKL